MSMQYLSMMKIIDSLKGKSNQRATAAFDLLFLGKKLLIGIPSTETTAGPQKEQENRLSTFLLQESPHCVSSLIPSILTCSSTHRHFIPLKEKRSLALEPNPMNIVISFTLGQTQYLNLLLNSTIIEFSRSSITL